MIETKALTKKFGKVKALDAVDIIIDKPGVVAVLGPNGSGKTTLIKTILGMVLPTSGDVLFQGASIPGKWEYRDRLDYLPQIARFPDNLTVRELINMIFDIRGRAPVGEDDRLIKLFGLVPHLNKKLGNLSGGTRQKVNIVLAFSFDNPLMVLDEPTAGLDPVSLVSLKELIDEQKKMGKTVLVTTHIMSLVEDIADDIIFLLEGKVCFKGPLWAIKERGGDKNLEKAIANLIKAAHVENT